MTSSLKSAPDQATSLSPYQKKQLISSYPNSTPNSSPHFKTYQTPLSSLATSSKYSRNRKTSPQSSATFLTKSPNHCSISSANQKQFIKPHSSSPKPSPNASKLTQFSTRFGTSPSSKTFPLPHLNLNHSSSATYIYSPQKNSKTRCVKL